MGFGDYVQTHEPNIKKNSMAPRTQGAIALLPMGNLQGSCKFFCLSTKTYVTRDKWDLVPTPQVVIDFMNNLNDKSAKKINRDPVFSYNDNIVQDDNDDEVDIYVQQPMHIPVGDRANGALEADEDQAFEVAWAADLHADALLRPGMPEADRTPPVLEEDIVYDDYQQGGGEANHGGDDDEHYGGDAHEQDYVQDDGASIPAGAEDPPEAPDFGHPEPERAGDEGAQVRRSSRAHTRSGGHWTHRGWVRDEVGLHITVSKALKKMPKAALREMYREMRQMVTKDVFEPVYKQSLTSQQRKDAIRSSMFLNEKFLPSGEFDKLKARLVAGGNMQDKSLYEDISSPTVTTQAVFMVAGIAAKEGRHVATVDIGGAYLNADMGAHEVHMRLDSKLAMILAKIEPRYEKFLCEDGTMIVKLKKALYGCIESAKLWYEHLCNTLEGMGFVRNPLDICVFNRVTKKGKQCTVIVHVDDLKITCIEEDEVDKVIDEVRKVYKEIKVHRGKVHSYLGMTFDYSKPDKVRISMEGYIADVMRLCNVQGKAKTPAQEDLFTVNEHAEKLSITDLKTFHSWVAKLLYAGKRTRADILTPIIFLSTRVKAADIEDWKKLDRVLRYVNGTQDLSLTIELGKQVSVLAYIDCSHGVHADGKGHTGSVISLGKGAVFAKSSKQKLVSKSSTETELIGLTDDSSQVIWTRNFLIHQATKVPPATIFQDNQSTLALVDKGRSTSARTRHINVRYFLSRIGSRKRRSNLFTYRLARWLLTS